jgi:hypothetical protein
VKIESIVFIVSLDHDLGDYRAVKGRLSDLSEAAIRKPVEAE